MEFQNTKNKVNSTKIINLKEVGNRLGRKDNESIKKWLIDNKVTIHRQAKLHYVYEAEFECVLLLPQVKDFQNKYPEKWESYYQKTIKDEAVFNLIMLQLQEDRKYKPTTKVKKSKADQELYNKLIS
jgi:hypothetical protein